MEFVGTLDTLEETEKYVKELQKVSSKLRDDLINSFPEETKEDLLKKLEAFQWKYRTLCENRDRLYMWQEGYEYKEIEKISNGN